MFINALGGYCICIIILGISLVRRLLLMFKVLGFSGLHIPSRLQTVKRLRALERKIY